MPSMQDVYNTSRSVEKFRIQISNRLSSIDRGVDTVTEPTTSLYESMDKQIREWEHQLDALMQDKLPEYPVYDYWLKHVKGIGPALSAHLLCLLLPPLPDRGPGTWFKAAGLYTTPATHEVLAPHAGTIHAVFTSIGMPVDKGDTLATLKLHDMAGYLPDQEGPISLLDVVSPVKGVVTEMDIDTDTYLQGDPLVTITSLTGRMPHLVKGEKVTYHRWLRRCLWLTSRSFMMTGGYYKTVYVQQVTRLTLLHSDWPKIRASQVARWITVKLFLSHLYEKWLQALDIPYERRIYAERVLGHTYIAPPEPDATTGKI